MGGGVGKAFTCFCNFDVKYDYSRPNDFHYVAVLLWIDHRRFIENNKKSCKKN